MKYAFCMLFVSLIWGTSALSDDINAVDRVGCAADQRVKFDADFSYADCIKEKEREK